MKTRVVLSGLVFVQVLVATATGIFYQTPGAPIEYITSACSWCTSPSLH